MATKTISITEEAYSRLASRKHGKESFSDVINRVAGRRSLSELAGILSKEEADKLEEDIKKGSELSRKRSIRMQKEMHDI